LSNSENITEERILQALRTVIDPDLHKDVVSLGMIKNISISGNDIAFRFELTTPACPLKDHLRNAAETALRRDIPEIGSIDIQMGSRVGAHMNDVKESLIPGVKNTIAVASGKGGVGKSTVAVNLAVALALDGAKVGLLDADIYGPSAPLMMGITGQPQVIDENGTKKLVPITSHGVKVMSIGFLVPPDEAMIWRGPMASGAVKQFLSDVEWGELDYLVFDLPPGTGDIQLTLVQTIPLTGAVIVTTPQDISLADAVKGIRMFEKVNVPILGIIENMSYHVCSECGHRDEIFSHGGGRKAAEKHGIAFLGEIPLYTKLREGGDAGTPIVIAEPESEHTKVFLQIARNMAAQVSIQHHSQGSSPEIKLSL